MPKFNQTGPMGQGAMTGRRMGKCTNYGAKNQETNEQGNNAGRWGRAIENQNQNQTTASAMGRGRGRGMGRGQGQRCINNQ